MLLPLLTTLCGVTVFNISIVSLLSHSSLSNFFTSLTGSHSDRTSPSWDFFFFSWCSSLLFSRAFSIIIYSIFSSNWFTWVRSFLMLSNTWYLFPHISTSLTRASPSLSMWYSIGLFPNDPPDVKSTKVCLQNFSPSGLMFSNMTSKCSSKNVVSAGITKRNAWGE